MKVQKYEIARVIDKLKSIVQKNDQFPALGGILVKDGYLIASNSEITMKVKLEASEGSYFIIPMKAFDLIKNLPDGEIDISATDKNVVMIKIGAIKNKYQSYPPEEFNFDITEDPEADGVELNGKKIMEAITGTCDLVQVLKRWGIKVTSYSGPNVKHGKLAYKSEKLGTVVVKILKEAKKKGGIEACLRAVKMNVTVVGFGTNKTVYHFEETQHLTEVNHKISTTGMVTRVKIIGKANDDGCSPVEATVDGKTSYGIRQKIVSRGTNDTLDEAKKEAREILADDGKPKEEITIKLPDIPIIRKGDKIHLKTASISAGYYIVISATHDVDKMLMTLGLKKAPAAKKSSGNKKTKAKSYDVGDIVNFHGGKHYVSSYPDARGYSVGAGKAKITIKGGSGKAHPWHLVTQNWNQTHVWGWVDDGSFD